MKVPYLSKNGEQYVSGQVWWLDTIRHCCREGRRYGWRRTQYYTRMQNHSVIVAKSGQAQLAMVNVAIALSNCIHGIVARGSSYFASSLNESPASAMEEMLACTSFYVAQCLSSRWASSGDLEWDSERLGWGGWGKLPKWYCRSPLAKDRTANPIQGNTSEKFCNTFIFRTAQRCQLLYGLSCMDLQYIY